MDKTKQKMCRKIRRALTISPAAAMHSFRWISNSSHQQDQSIRSSTKILQPHSSNVVQNEQESYGVVPIEYNRSVPVEHGRNIIEHSQHVAVEGKVKVKANNKLRLSSESDNSMNERFSNYINRAKQTMITKTSFDKLSERVDNEASAYINRTKQRFRASSGTGAGAGSFKKREIK